MYSYVVAVPPPARPPPDHQDARRTCDMVVGSKERRVSNSTNGTELPIMSRITVRYLRAARQVTNVTCTATFLILLPPTMSHCTTLAHKVPRNVVKSTYDLRYLRYMSGFMREHDTDGVYYSVQDFIDDRAFETDNEEDDAPDDDDESSEVQLRRLDEQDFDMPAILDGHNECLRVDPEEPYRIPEHLVQLSGAETPAHGEDDYQSDVKMHSRPTSPAPSWTPQPMSRAATPAYMPVTPSAAQPVILPDPVTAPVTPFAYHGPPLLRDSTPYLPFASSQTLFLPHSRGPTPFMDDSTSYPPSSSLHPMAPRSPLPAPDSPPPKRRHVDSPPGSPTAATSSTKRAVLQFFDTAAGDSDEDIPEEDEDDKEETLSDAGISVTGFIDDDVPEDGLPNARPIFDDDSDDDLHEASDEKIQQLVARYEKEAGKYARDAKRERGHRSYKRLLVGPASVEKPVLLATPPVDPQHDPLVSTVPVDPQHDPLVSAALVDPDNDVDNIAMPPPGKLRTDVCTKISFSQPLMRKDHPILHPTRNELAPFQRTSLHYLQGARFWGDTGFGLMEGDRVGWIGRIVKKIVGGTFRCWVKLTQYFGTIPDTQKTPGEMFALTTVARHILDPGPTVHLLDRVQVKYGRSWFIDKIGRIVEISGPTLTVELPEDTVGNVDPGHFQQNTLTGGWRFNIPTSNTVRHFMPGDLIRVVYGDLSGRRGFIVHIHPSGVLEIFDDHERPGQEHVFLVRQSDVEFVILEDNAAFSDYSTYQYTTRSEINPPIHPLAEFEPVNLEKIQSRLRVASGRLAEYLAEVKGDEVKGDECERANLKRYREDLVTYIEKLTHPLTIKGIQERDREADARACRLMNTGKRYEGREVEVIGKDPDKGTWGTVVGDHDSEARAQCMKAWTSANPDKDVYGRCWWDSWGILVSIRTHTGSMIQDIPVENLVMRRHDLSRKPVPLTRAYHLPSALSTSPVLAVPRPRAFTPPPLSSTLSPRPRTPSPPPTNEPLWPAAEQKLAGKFLLPQHDQILTLILGEDMGEWMCIPALKGKHVDVVLEGVDSIALQTHRIFKTSAKIRALEGKAGYLLLADAIDPKSLDKKKVQVFGFSVLHGIGPMCIKPQRFDDNGTTRIDAFKERVVIVGLDILGDIVAKGCYAQTRPHVEHTHGSGIVEV
ncbi:hypothetical protein B0H11DRAFT_1934776 [Mycena galericulata]|nr:hypothetical protein B0H11DRAFT_1934776 [Mycena galericulata]